MLRYIEQPLIEVNIGDNTFLQQRKSLNFDYKQKLKMPVIHILY